MEQWPEEIENFALWLRSRFIPGTVIELGVRHGGTSVLWHELLPATRVIGVDRVGHDSYQEPEFSQRANRMRSEFSRYFFVEGDSQRGETKRHVESLISDPVTFLFIDADHSYNGIWTDFALWSPLVVPGGVIAFHDIVDGPRTGGGVAKFWKEQKGVLHEFRVNPASDWGGIGAMVKE
jgi:cephalosporin hydroxylase